MTEAPRMSMATFLRRHADRTPSLTWLLGAGASASAGIATAGQMTWEFKRKVFCSEERVALATCQDLNDPRVQEQINRHFASGPHPRAGDPDEYAHYFELAHHTEKDRRRYIDAKVQGAHPSFGHIAMAALMKADKIRIVWTTNFDADVETVAGQLFDSAAALTVVSLDNPQIAEQAIREERWPVLGKLHGDFRSERLKNTHEELRQQDAQFRQVLTDSCKRMGLVTIGYSGRDNSVMRALSDAAVSGGFPAGLFWIQHAADPVPPAVEALISRAAAAGIDAAIVEGETFDEVLGDVMRQTPNMPRELTIAAEQQAPRCQDAPIPATGQGFPVVRTNALLVSEFPSVCRVIQSDIGGAKELRAAISAADVKDDLVAARTSHGVLAFGSDHALKAALANTTPRDPDLHAIEPDHLAWESSEHGLIVEACVRAIVRDRPLIMRRRRRGWVVLVDPEQTQHDDLIGLTTATGGLIGNLPSGTGRWAEASAARLDYRLGRLWLLVEPMIWLTPSEGRRPTSDIDFVRERMAKRYNAQINGVLGAWVDLILGDQSASTVQTFGGTDGVDATFTIHDTTAFSRRALRTAAALDEVA